MPDRIAPFPAADHAQGRTDNLVHCVPKRARFNYAVSWPKLNVSLKTLSLLESSWNLLQNSY